jgi:hypothetical protein
MPVHADQDKARHHTTGERMIRRPNPIDELAEVRAEIARLQQREAALEAAFIRQPNLGTIGAAHRVEVTEVQTRVFDPTLLPDRIRTDPAFWRDQTSVQVTCAPIPAKPKTLRPGWPINRRNEVGLRAVH